MERLPANRLILLILALIWAWNGIGYHLLFFFLINSAAKFFAGFFVLQVILLGASAVPQKGLRFEVPRDLGW